MMMSKGNGDGGGFSDMDADDDQRTQCSQWLGRSCILSKWYTFCRSRVTYGLRLLTGNKQQRNLKG
jgi:hypothetical protein